MSKSKLLIVEDDADTRAMLQVLLDDLFDCKDAATRDEALKLIESGTIPACILMDYSMPGMTLDEFMARLKQHRLQIVLATARSDAREIAGKFGIKYLLAKPINPDEMIAAIQRAIGSGERTAI